MIKTKFQLSLLLLILIIPQHISIQDASLSVEENKINDYKNYEVDNSDLTMSDSVGMFEGLDGPYTSLAGGYYMPDTCTSRIKFSITPISTDSDTKLRLNLFNPDESYARLLSIYVDGVKRVDEKYISSSFLNDYYKYIDLGSAAFGGWFFSNYQTYELEIELRCASLGDGYYLREISFINGGDLKIGAHVYDNIPIFYDYPYQSTEIFYAYVSRDYGIDIELSGSATGGTLNRKVYLYIDGVNRGYQYLYPGGNKVSWFGVSGIGDDSIISIQFKIYVPCTSCNEFWSIDYWELGDSESHRIQVIDKITLKTDWVPSSETRSDILSSLEYFAAALWDASEGQVLIKFAEAHFGIYDSSTCPPYVPLCSSYNADFNIFEGDIPKYNDDRPRAFLGSRRTFYSSETPYKFYGVPYSDYMWQWINADISSILGGEIYSFLHEFSHSYFSLPDEYKDSEYDVNRIMNGKGGNGRASEWTSRGITGGFNAIPIKQQPYFPDYHNAWDWMKKSSQFSWFYHPEPIHQSWTTTLSNYFSYVGYIY